MYCGWDWGSATHGVCLIDERGAVVRRWVVEHSEAGLGSVLDDLSEYGSAGDIPIAIERGEGLVVGRLAARGHPVVVADPAGFKAARPRWSSSLAKSDPGDAFMLADYLRTDGHRLRRLAPYDQATADLTALMRTRKSLVDSRTAASNMLWALLGEHWPGARAVFQKLTSKIALAFLSDYPTPGSAAHMGEARMAQFCRRHSYNGGRSPAQLLERLQGAPVPVTRISDAVLAAMVAAHVAQLRVLNSQLAALQAQIVLAVESHPKAPLLETLPRTAPVSLGMLLAEVGPILQRCSTAEQAAAMCGAAPVTRASGKTRNVGFRYAASVPARLAITSFADNSRHSSAWAANSYQQARARGARHPHAIRIVARGWVRVLWACWHSGEVYDPSQHKGEQLARST